MTEQTATRLKALRQRMAETGTGLVAIAPGSHMDWVLGFHPHPDERPCLLLIGPEKEAFLMPVLNAEGTRELTDIAFHNWADEVGPVEALAAALADIRAEAPASSRWTKPCVPILRCCCSMRCRPIRAAISHPRHSAAFACARTARNMPS